MKKGRPGKKIMCVNDCKVYDTISTAAQTYQTTQSAISKQIHGQRKSVKGFYFIEVSGNETVAELQAIQKNILETVYKFEVI